MRMLLTDTSFIVALVDADDVHHTHAVEFLNELREVGDVSLLLTDHIFDETMTVVKRRMGSRVAVSTGQRLRKSRLFQRLRISEEDDDAAWEIFSRYVDKEWSYTDCSCLAVMRRMGISEALSFDHHFDQMGVTRLPAVSLTPR